MLWRIRKSCRNTRQSSCLYRISRSSLNSKNHEDTEDLSLNLLTKFANVFSRVTRQKLNEHITELWFHWITTAKSYYCVGLNCVYTIRRAKYHPLFLKFSSVLSFTETPEGFLKFKAQKVSGRKSFHSLIAWVVNDRDVNGMRMSARVHVSVHSNIYFFISDAFTYMGSKIQRTIWTTPIGQKLQIYWKKNTKCILTEGFWKIILVFNFELDQKINKKGNVVISLHCISIQVVNY